MIYELNDTDKVRKLFEGWKDTLIDSCLQGIMGKIYVTDLKEPVSAMAFAGCFAFYAGVPDPKLIREKPEGSVIMTPQNDQWAACIEECFPDAEKHIRYAMKRNTCFDESRLHQMVRNLPDGYELKQIDAELYDRCLCSPLTSDFVSCFAGKQHYLEMGRGVVILKEGRIVSGASSYTRYREGIEIETDTAEEERRRGLASAACAALILRCRKEGLYPGWDAQNRISVRLAEKLGYEPDRAYTVYEIS